MALARIKTWIAEILTAADLNAEFNNILNNALTLISPLTGSLDADGQIIVLDADADTTLRAATDNVIDFRIGGTDRYKMTATGLTTNGVSLVESEGAAVASAATANIWAGDGNTVHITGTTTITSFGTAPQAGAWMKVIFDGALTLTHGANLSLPGSANITTAADDIAYVYADTTTQFDVVYFKKSGAAVVNFGLQTIAMPAGAMTAATTNGAAAASVELATNKNMLRVLDFDTATEEFAQFDILMPKSWNEGTVTFQPLWTAASGSGGVVWALQAVATSDDDAMDVAFGTQVTSIDSFILANDCHIGPESLAITIGGTPAESDRVNFRIKRVVGDASDTLAVDARLIGIRLFYTTNSGTDT